MSLRRGCLEVGEKENVLHLNPSLNTRLAVRGRRHSFPCTPSMVSLMQLLTDIFDFGILRPYQSNGTGSSLVDWDRMMDNKMHFHAATVYRISRAMYNPTVPKWPLDAKVSFGGFGNTSLRMMVELFALGSHEPIITRSSISVLVCQETRRPTPFPDWLKRSLKGKEVDMDAIRVDIFSRPANTFVHKLKVVDSYTDGYNHATYTSYVQFGLDALHLALSEKSKCLQAQMCNARISDGHVVTNQTQLASEKSANLTIKDTCIVQNDVKKESFMVLNTALLSRGDAQLLNEISHTRIKQNAQESAPGTAVNKFEINTNCDNRTINLQQRLVRKGNSFSLENPYDHKIPGAAQSIYSNTVSAIKCMTEDITKNGLKTVKVCYVKECVEGDMINVHVWQEQGEAFIFRCSIESEDGSRIHSQVTLEYFEPSAHL